MPRIAANHIPGRRRNVGFTLIEVLVAVLVLSIGLLGVAGLQILGLRSSQGAYQSSQATAVLGDLIDRMRANPQGVSAGAYDDIDVDVASATELADPNCASATAGCSPAQLATHDIRDWTLNSLARLGGGTAATVTGDEGDFTLTVTWNDVAERDEEGELEPRTLTMQVNLQ